MSKKPYAALAIGLALLSSSPAFAVDPVSQFTFRLAGLNITGLMPEVKRIIAVCRIDNHLGIRVSEGRRYFDVTEAHGEHVVHIEPFTIGQNI